MEDMLLGDISGSVGEMPVIKAMDASFFVGDEAGIMSKAVAICPIYDRGTGLPDEVYFLMANEFVGHGLPDCPCPMDLKMDSLGVEDFVSRAQSAGFYGIGNMTDCLTMGYSILEASDRDGHGDKISRCPVLLNPDYAGKLSEYCNANDKIPNSFLMKNKNGEYMSFVPDGLPLRSLGK
jgi:hypothetical protein